MKPRWMLYVLIPTTGAVIVFWLSLMIPSGLVTYHLSRIEANQKIQVHMTALQNLGKLAHQPLLNRLEADAAIANVDDFTSIRYQEGHRRRAASALLLSRAYSEKNLSSDNIRRFLDVAFTPKVTGFDARIVPCLLPVVIKWPSYWSNGLDGDWTFGIDLTPTLIVENEMEIETIASLPGFQ